MKLRLHLLVLCVIIIFLVYNMASFQHKQTSVTTSIPWFIETGFCERKYT
ncbi:bromodomain 4 [Zea mays]|uniref:Bromodomain 4 n=1 Tax=Zea mays TaxID=4577 RepID=A0A1D6EYD2_MAIZE|nr:bromodomain 4 [Zea mays]